ncbi:MAG: hypothetical protein FVQ83_14845 [Chloroflexi bacterium]|nr:hypothetical protein [Chloroflexota bacterium]
MTVGVVIKCHDGIVVACDSLETFSRGVPVRRHSNKVQVIEHDGLLHPVAITGAGMSTFVDKFVDRANRDIIDIASQAAKRDLDIVDFSERVGETITSFLFKEYVIDRYEFFGTRIGEYSLSIMVAGATADNRLRTYLVHSMGLTERIVHYGTIGSGAAYAELFLKELVPTSKNVSVNEAACLAGYAIKGVELMDPYVGGETNIQILKMDKDELKISPFPKSKMPKGAKKKMEGVLKNMGESMRSLVAR